MMATRGLIVPENTLTLVPCKSQFNSIFRTKNGQLVVADPTVKLAEGMNLQVIGSGYLHALDGSTAHHTVFSGDFLYKADQLEAFNQLIHFERAKTHVLDSLVRQYCHDATEQNSNCESYTPGHPGQFGFDMKQLEITILAEVNWSEYFYHQLKNWGGYCSIAVILYLVGEGFYTEL